MVRDTVNQVEMVTMNREGRKVILCFFHRLIAGMEKEGGGKREGKKVILCFFHTFTMST